MQLDFYIPATRTYSRITANPNRAKALKCHCVVIYVRRLDYYAAPATICFKPPSHAFLGDDPSLQSDMLVKPSLNKIVMGGSCR